jgi:ABC-type siderophore export system fused ATPase/permease subunit
MSALTGIPIEELFSREGKELVLPEFGGELTVGRVSQIYANFNREKFGHNFYNILMEKEIERIVKEKIEKTGKQRLTIT